MGFRSSLLRSNSSLTAANSSRGVARVDPYFSYVTALLHGDGTNGSQTITDVKGNTWACTGSAAISTSQRVFGPSCLYGGNSSLHRMQTTATAAMSFGTQPFCIEGYFRLASLANFRYVWGLEGDLLFGMTTSNKMAIWAGGNPVLTMAAAISANTWYYSALCRIGNTHTLYVGPANGAITSVGTYSNSGSRTGSSLYIGDKVGNNSSEAFVDEFRVTVGVPRYTGTFFPPIAPHPDQ